MKISIVTPLRDEINNIDKLFESISNQTVKINNWIIVENDSRDGSKEYLKEKIKPKNVENLTILNLSLGGEYQLGNKYSHVINEGFKYIEKHIQFEYLAILDSDCFPEPKYYETLINYLINHKNVGIISGVIRENGKIYYDPNHARGGCRVWRKECYLNSGYIVTMSADSVSEVLARLNNWKTKSIKDTYVISRALGKKIDYEYYGRSAYYRGFNIKYIILKTIYTLMQMKFMKSYKYFKGYITSYVKNDQRISHDKVREYYDNYLLNKINSYFK